MAAVYQMYIICWLLCLPKYLEDQLLQIGEYIVIQSDCIDRKYNIHLQLSSFFDWITIIK